jgi:hypothetical protein
MGQLEPFAPHEPPEPPGWPGVVLCTGTLRTNRSQPGPPVPHTEASAVLAVGCAGFGGPAIGGVVEFSATGTVFGARPHGLPAGPHPVCGVTAALAAGVTGLGAPLAGGVALASATDWAGLGAPVLGGVAVVSDAGLAVGAGFAPDDAPLAGDALGAGGAGFGAVLALSALDPPEPLDGELDDAAGFGALALPGLEPLSEDDFAAAGFGAGFAPPEPPEGPPATLATVRTATEEDASPGVGAEEAVVACVDESSVPSIHTRAVVPRSTDTDAARHSRTNTAISTRTGIARDTAGTGTGGTTQLRRPPAEATDTITNTPRVGAPRRSTDPSCRPTKSTRKFTGAALPRRAIPQGGVRGSQAPSSDRIASRGHVTRRPTPSAEHSGHRYRRPPQSRGRRSRLPRPVPTATQSREISEFVTPNPLDFEVFCDSNTVRCNRILQEPNAHPGCDRRTPARR